MDASCLTVGQCFNTLRREAAKLLVYNQLFEFRPSMELGAARYGLIFKEQKKYQYLKDLPTNLFEYMVMELLSIKAYCENSCASGLTILCYNVGWKKYVSFHLRLYSRTVDEFRDTIRTLWNGGEDEEEAVDALTNNKHKPTEADYVDFRLHLEHIQEHGHDPEFFQQHAAATGSSFGIKRLLISRRGNCLVGLDSIDYDPTTVHPYQLAYQYARALEEELGNEVLGRVCFGIDHDNKKIWVWGLCIKAEYEIFVHRSGIVKNGEFKDSKTRPKRTGALEPNCVIIRNLPEGVNEELVCKYLRQCGLITKVNLHRYRDGDDTPNGTAKVFFEDERAADNAVGLNQKIIVRGNIWKIKYSYST